MQMEHKAADTQQQTHVSALVVQLVHQPAHLHSSLQAQK
jgi:hypothetical protein